MSAIEAAITKFKFAQKQEADGRLEEAYRTYMSALSAFELALKYETNPKHQEIIYERVFRYMDHVHNLKMRLDEGPAPGAPSQRGRPPGAPKSAPGTSEALTDPPATSIGLRSPDTSPNVSWDDVIGLLGAKEALKEAVYLPLRFPSLFRGKRRPCQGILLYGPPGTGKSHLAQALATEAKVAFFSVSSSDLLSKWFGESEKTVRQLFTDCTRAAPSIVFMDEIDALCTTRSETDSEASRRLKTEILIQMSQAKQQGTRVLVLAATNLPWMLDPAVRRRFEKRIYIGLPSLPARAQLIASHLEGMKHTLTQDGIHQIAERLQGYSAFDVNIIVQEALMQPIRLIQEATHFKPVMGQPVKWTPCSPGDPEAVPKSINDLSAAELEEPPVEFTHFCRALIAVKPSIRGLDLSKYEEFTRDFGQDG